MDSISIFIYLIILILMGFKAEIHRKRYQLRITMPPYFIVLTEFIGTIASISIIFFGFIYFKWWIPIILFLIAIIIKKGLSLFIILKIGIQRYTWFLLSNTLLVNLIIIGLSMFLWIF